MLVLGIESSCDETAAAVVRDGRIMVSNIVSSQVAIHRPHGGVVPELASRHHIQNIVPVVTNAMNDAGIAFTDLSGIAVTHGPGLVGSLLVGVQFAKALAFSWDLPLIGINHLEGHLYGCHLEPGDLPPERHLALLVSGGHTLLILVETFGQYRILGSTRDDAAGEAFDKVAKLLGLGYPGGPVIERLSKGGDAQAVPLPRALPRQRDYDFSFSGLKTAVLTHVNAHGVPQGQALADLCASFQQAVADVLVRKTLFAAEEHHVNAVVATGGVLANRAIRGVLAEKLSARQIKLFTPPLSLCTDNGAMIAVAGTHRLQRGERSGLDLNPSARIPLA